MQAMLGMAGLLASMFLVSPALALTQVSGAIAVDTRWTVSAMPYVVNGDVVVQNGATLTIDPGVTIYMAANAGLAVQAGAIKASGTSSQPIQVLSDKARQGQTSAPGDWKQWTFNAGTMASTRLDYVVFEHGKGLAINGASPVLNNISLRNHNGAAISVDLAASPTGAGLQASGNTLNGIAVPSGDIGGSVRWGLRGIPYVVASGAVSVGASPKVTSITPNVLQQGETATLNVAGTRLGGLTRARFDRAGLTADVLAGGSDQQASLSVTADVSTAVGTAVLSLLVDAGEARIFNAITVVPSQPTLTSLSPAALYLGQGTVDVAALGRGFSADSIVLVNGAPVTTRFSSSGELHADVLTPSAASNLQVRLRTPDPANAGQFLTSNELILPVLPAQITLSPQSTSVAKGSGKTFSVSLPYPAPTGGVSLSLVSSVPSVASVASSVTVPQGKTTASIQLTALDLGNTVLTASRPGFVSGQAQVTVVPPPSLAITPSTATLGVGRTAELTVQASVPAGASGLTVTLTSNQPTIATVPAQITIPAGASSATVSVSTVAIGSATITAQSAEFVSSSATITVRPVSINLPTGALVAPGLTRTIPLTLSDPAPAGGLLVTLSSSNSAIATTQASITVPQGQTQANFTVTGVGAGSANINATASGYQSAAVPVTVEAVTISIGSPAVSAISVPVDNTHTYTVNLSRPAPAGGVVVDLSVSDSAKLSVSPASVSIAEGQTSGGVVTIGLTGLVKGSATLAANAAGLTAATIPVTVQAKPALVFESPSVTVGKGLNTYYYEVYVRRKVDGSDYAPDKVVVLNLTSSDETKLKVPATVTIPAGYSYVYFTVTGVDLTGSTPVSIDATASGYTAPATKLAGHVVAPVFNFSGLDTNRSPASARDDVRVSVTVPGANYGYNQTAVADMPIDLAIVEANPAGIVEGFHGTQTGGTAVTQLMLRKDNTYSAFAYVDTPTVAGSYKVRASAAGIATATSEVVTVTAPALKFTTSTVTVGKGLNTYYYEVGVERQVNGQGFAGAQALTVNLTSSDASKAGVPATVTIPEGQSAVYFPVTGVGLTGDTPVTIDATASGYTTPATKLAGHVVAPVFNFSDLDSNRSPASARDGMRVYVTTPGAAYAYNQTAAADMPIDLAIVEGNPAGIVDGFYNAQADGSAVTQLTLRKDNTYSTFAYVGTPTAAGSYKVRASASGIATSTSDVVTVTAPALKFNRSSVTVGKGLNTYYYEVGVERQVNGQGFAGAQALTVTLSSTDASKANVPTTVTIPAGESTVYFPVTGIDLTGNAPVTIDAAANGYTAPQTKLTGHVVAPVFNFSEVDTNRSPASTRDNIRVYVTTPGAAYGYNQTAAADMAIDLAIVDGNPAGIVNGFYSAETGGTAVTQLTLRKDNNYSTYAYVGTPTVAGAYKIAASAAGVATATSDVVTVSAPELRFSRSSVTVGKGLKTYYYEVYVERRVNNQAFNGVDAVTVNLTCNAAAVCQVPASVTIPAGQNGVYFQVVGTGLGNTTITASAVGYSAPQDLGVNVIAPVLEFSGPGDISVGAQTQFRLYLSVPGSSYSGSQTAMAPFTVNVTSSSPGVATVTPSVEILVDYAYSGLATLTGIAPGTTTLTASGSGLTSTTSGVVTINP